MSQERTVAWLAQLQARFSAALRTPLDPGSGTLRAAVARYPRAACDDVLPGPVLAPEERLAVYNRQYWMRLFKLLQHELPLTCRLLGPWNFNRLATRFLLAHPPRFHDVARVADGFERFLEQDLREDHVQLGRATPPLPRAALLEAARLDMAFRRVFFAPEQPRFEPAGLSARALVGTRLVLSATQARIEERWPLVRLRSDPGKSADERPVALPDALPRPQHWLLLRHERGVGQVALEPLQARLLALLETHTVADALGRLEAECPRAEREGLPARLQRFLAQSATAGVFSGFTVEGAHAAVER